MKKKRIVLIIGILLIMAVMGLLMSSKDSKKQAMADDTGFNEAKVVKGYIKDSISNSSVIESEKRQQINIKKAGTIEKVYVKEGQRVEKGDMLLVMESGNENTDLEIAKKNLELEVAELEDLKKDVSNSKIYAKESGIYKESDSKLELGKSVNVNQTLGTLHDGEALEAKLLFNLGSQGHINVGDTADIVIPETFETMVGNVVEVNESSSILDSGNFGIVVTIDIPKKAAIKDSYSPQATIHTDNGSFNSLEVISIGQKKGVSVISEVKGTLKASYVKEGDVVNNGDLLFEIENMDLDKHINKQEITIEQKLLDIKNKAENLEDVAITSPISGTVIKLSANDGDNVDANTSIALIADTDNLKTTLEVDELDIFNVEMGQNALITTDVFKNKKFKGIVDNIAMEGKHSNGVTTFEVDIALDELSSKNFKLGMSVDVEISQGEKDDALLLPVEAVKKLGNKYMVMTSLPNTEGGSNKKDRKSGAKEVKVGIVTETMVEIIEGLREGDTVYYSKKISTNSSNTRAPMMMGMPGGRKPSNKR